MSYDSCESALKEELPNETWHDYYPDRTGDSVQCVAPGSLRSAARRPSAHLPLGQRRGDRPNRRRSFRREWTSAEGYLCGRQIPRLRNLPEIAQFRWFRDLSPINTQRPL